MSKQETARDAIEGLMAGYEKLGYVSDEKIATALFLAQKLENRSWLKARPGLVKPNWPRPQRNIWASI